MNVVRIILEYKDLFDDKPKDIDYYLNGICKETLLRKALYYCSISTLLSSGLDKLFYPFLLESDRDTLYENNLKRKVAIFIKKNKALPAIVNVRSSLKFFELIQDLDSSEVSDLSESEMSQNLLKIYLLLNSTYNTVFSERENLNEMLISQSLVQSIYSGTNCYYLRIAELIKSCLFLEFCSSYIPNHTSIFLQEYGITTWQEYVINIYQIGMLIISRNLDNPLSPISIPIDDNNYNKKVKFFDKFCMSEIYHNDKDYTNIKAKPVIKNEKKGEYNIIFEQFFIEKMFKGLYFNFKKINESFEDSEHFINKDKFRSDFGKKFSEQILLNKIIKDSIGKKYKHLGYKELQRDGNPDYYIRDGKYIFLFECKDNFIKKEVVELANIDIFLNELEHIFIENDKGKAKAIKQLINNIIDIRNGNFIEDKGIKPKNNILYPIIVTHNTLFSLTGINMLLNEWFFKEIGIQEIDKQNIKNLTVININTLILIQGLLSQKEFSLKTLIDSYWLEYNKASTKVYPTPEIVINERLKVSWSFDKFVERKIKGKNLFTKELKKYNSYFETT